jgi:hypothetical protein
MHEEKQPNIEHNRLWLFMKAGDAHDERHQNIDPGSM